MQKKVKWGIIGYARIAKNEVIPAILRTEDAQLYAIASEDLNKREECQKSYSGVKVYNQYEELLDDTEIDAVYLPLPNSLHKEWAIKAMKRGKHVLCEKPIALNAADCLEMIQVAQAEGIMLMEAFMYRYTDRIQKVCEILASKEIGSVKFIHSTFRFLLNRPNTIKVRSELGGGSLYDVGCYPVNFAGMITNEIPESCQSECVVENGVDIIFSAVLKYPSGIMASINCGFNAFNQMSSEIVGTKGRIEISDTFLGTKGIITIVTDEGSRQVVVDDSDRYALEVADFTNSILQKQRPYLSLDESYRNMQVMDMLFQSISKSNPIDYIQEKA
ncbi:MAG TPA: Gfo/Idh/MocA family oxidoreductase [Bacillota bacterium]|nr:Gfo/Idh/MocA family oxidoreductase [Bacillota bacterium]